MSVASALGIDLAWSDKRLSGCTALDQEGLLVDERLVRTDEEIVDWVVNMAVDDATVAIDAPLLVPNDTGNRPCESEITSTYGSRKLGAHSSNRTLFFKRYGRIRGEDLSDRLADFGFADPWTASRRTLLEVYPHPALVEMFSLDERLLYKKGDVGQRRRGLRQLDELLATLETVSPPLRALSVTIEDGHRGRALKDIEDRLDARVCAWIAAAWNSGGQGRVRLFGDGRSGHIGVPIGPAVDPDVARAILTRAGPEDTAAADRGPEGVLILRVFCVNGELRTRIEATSRRSAPRTAYVESPADVLALVQDWIAALEVSTEPDA